MFYSDCYITVYTVRLRVQVQHPFQSVAVKAAAEAIPLKSMVKNTTVHSATQDVVIYHPV